MHGLAADLIQYLSYTWHLKSFIQLRTIFNCKPAGVKNHLFLIHDSWKHINILFFTNINTFNLQTQPGGFGKTSCILYIIPLTSSVCSLILSWMQFAVHSSLFIRLIQQVQYIACHKFNRTFGNESFRLHFGCSQNQCIIKEVYLVQTTCFI